MNILSGIPWPPGLLENSQMDKTSFLQGSLNTTYPDLGILQHDALLL